MTMSMQRAGVMASAALSVMHPDLYRAGVETHIKLGSWAQRWGMDDMSHHLRHWTSVFNVASVMCNRRSPLHRDPKCRPEAFDIMTSFGQHEPALMHLTNLGIKLVYDSAVMVACSCRLIRHGISVDHGDRIVWAWYMRDSVHNHVLTPRPDYARYPNTDLEQCCAYMMTKWRA